MRRAKQERAKLDRLTARCEACQRPITSGQTWKFTETGGKVHYHCANNPASWTLDPRHVLRYGTVMKHPRRTAKPKRTSRAMSGRVETGTFHYKGARIWQDGDGWRVSADPDSVFDTKRDAQKFVDSIRKRQNPAMPWWKRRSA